MALQLLSLALQLAALFPAAQPPAHNPTSRRHQLFFDLTPAGGIESSSSVGIMMHPAQFGDRFGGPPAGALVPEAAAPWEGGRFNYYHSVLDNGTHLLLYYDALSNMGPVKNDLQRTTCLAVSASKGATWTRPRLGLVEFNGSRDNNIVWPLNNSAHSPGAVSRRRDCHSANTPSPSLLKHLPKGEGGAAE